MFAFRRFGRICRWAAHPHRPGVFSPQTRCSAKLQVCRRLAAHSTNHHFAAIMRHDELCCLWINLVVVGQHVFSDLLFGSPSTCWYTDIDLCRRRAAIGTIMTMRQEWGTRSSFLRRLGRRRAVHLPRAVVQQPPNPCVGGVRILSPFSSP